MKTHMVIGDAHAKPGVSNDRFEWLGHMAVDQRPDVIVDMGDWADMESLCSYDKGHKSFEGRRYQKDVAAARDARERFAAPIAEYNRRYPKDAYKPRLIALGGNHDQGRIERVCQLQPEFDGVISVTDLGAEEYGWEWHNFLEPVSIDGVNYVHYSISGVKALPIGTAAFLLSKRHVSMTTAHSHLFDYAVQTCGDGRKIAGLIAGCYFEHQERYAGRANGLWWRGVVMCHDVKDGFYDLEQVRIQRIKKVYG